MEDKKKVIVYVDGFNFYLSSIALYIKKTHL